ncbi:unnamed protein product [Fusarium fujikuroi]|nr:unnamed protein product [Fusarium fujikuroi]
MAEANTAVPPKLVRVSHQVSVTSFVLDQTLTSSRHISFCKSRSMRHICRITHMGKANNAYPSSTFTQTSYQPPKHAHPSHNSRLTWNVRPWTLLDK